MVFQSTILRPAIGRCLPMISPIARLFGLGRTFLPVVGALYSLMIISYMLVWMVDPYALRPFGAIVRLGDFAYADDVVPRLFAIAAQDGTDLVVVGGSTSASITNAMLREAYPEAKKPVNLSFAGQSADGLAADLAQLAKSDTLRRVILTLDWNLISNGTEGQKRVDRFYSGSWHDPVPEFDFDAIVVAARLLFGGGPDLPDRRRRNPDRPDFMKTSSPMPEWAIAKMARAADVSRPWITQAPSIPCNAISSLHNLILPFVQVMAARGVPVDLFVPPYSLAMYSDWSVNMPDGRIFRGKGSTFANLLALRRCAVELAATTDNLRVYAFDTDLSLTHDLSRYYDTGHLNDPDAYRYILRSMRRGDSVLTLEKWPSFESAFRRAVEEFRP
jgi:hypothetical protein